MLAALARLRSARTAGRRLTQGDILLLRAIHGIIVPWPYWLVSEGIKFGFLLSLFMLLIAVQKSLMLILRRLSL
jgi:predicted transcriptional regulator